MIAESTNHPGAWLLPEPAVDEGVTAALEAFRQGRMVLLADHDEGVLVIPAQAVTGDVVNLMARLARGLVCVALTGARLDALRLPMLATDGTGLAFACSVEAREGVTSGISAPDRAATVRALIDPDATPADLLTPGHMFPIRVAEGGVLQRPRTSEAAVDLCRLSDRYPAAVVCTVLDADGGLASRSRLHRLSRRLKAPVLDVEQLLRYRLAHEWLIEPTEVPEHCRPSDHWQAVSYRSRLDDRHYVAAVLGRIDAEAMPVVVHRCSGAVFHDARRLSELQRQIEAAGRGVIIYCPESASCDGLRDQDGLIEKQIAADLGIHTPVWLEMEHEHERG